MPIDPGPGRKQTFRTETVCDCDERFFPVFVLVLLFSAVVVAAVLRRCCTTRTVFVRAGVTQHPTRTHSSTLSLVLASVVNVLLFTKHPVFVLGS